MNNQFGNTENHLSLIEVKKLFCNLDKLAKYLWDNYKDELTRNSNNELDYACIMGEQYGFIKGFLPNIKQLLSNEIKELNNYLSKESLTLYRGIELVGDDDVDLSHPGNCWTPDYETALEFVKQFDDDDDPNMAPCILQCNTTIENIDWLMSCVLNLIEPEEHELRIWDDTVLKNLEYEVL